MISENSSSTNDSTNDIPVVIGTAVGTDPPPPQYLDTTCSICLGPLSGVDDGTPPPTLVSLECGHLFHSFCLNSHLASSQQQSQPPSCPNCRFPISTTTSTSENVAVGVPISSSSSHHPPSTYSPHHLPEPEQVPMIRCRGCGKMFIPRSESSNQAGYYRCGDCVGVGSTVMSICPLT